MSPEEVPDASEVGKAKPKEKSTTKARKSENTKKGVPLLFFVLSSFRVFVIGFYSELEWTR